MMVWMNITGGDSTISLANPTPDDKVCYDKARKPSRSCKSRSDLKCNGSGKFIRMGRPGSFFCRQRCVKNPDSMTLRFLRPWTCGKCR